jgi:hypothetical protein
MIDLENWVCSLGLNEKYASFKVPRICLDHAEWLSESGIKEGLGKSFLYTTERCRFLPCAGAAWRLFTDIRTIDLSPHLAMRYENKAILNVATTWPPCPQDGGSTQKTSWLS